MNDVFGYIAYGDNELYHYGALLSASAHSSSCTFPQGQDRHRDGQAGGVLRLPGRGDAYLGQAERRDVFRLALPFRYQGRLPDRTLKQADRLIFMDSDHYPIADPSKGFGRISPTRSFMRKQQLKVMSAIEHCRTAALGGHVEACEDCGQLRIAYSSCRNRHCPKCRGATARTWLAEHEADLLPFGYFAYRGLPEASSRKRSVD